MAKRELKPWHYQVTTALAVVTVASAEAQESAGSTAYRVDSDASWIRVLAWPDCTPVANARVAHWQAGEDGRYADRLRAWLATDENGRYRFETEWPDMTSPHIHFIVTGSGYQTLETQWIGNERSDRIEFDMVLKPVKTRQ